MTLVGHSLGAGVAAILACILKDMGLKRLRCYAFETPACVGRVLAEECGGRGKLAAPATSASVFHAAGLWWILLYPSMGTFGSRCKGLGDG